MGDRESVSFTMKRIRLTNGGFATVDAEDVSRVAGHPWRRMACGYVAYNTPRDALGKQKIIYMHRVILRAAKNQEVDHRGSRTDNRKSKLRLCSSSQNQASAKIKGRNRSGFRGVFPAIRPPGWKASIRVRGVLHHLGYFGDKRMAAVAYDRAAKKFFKEFAQPNFSA